jgi:D-alanyl-lipoteichoic acid acyltransferase DltB (MBOAT superfamily)
MIFHSFDFLLFFAATFLLYWASPFRVQNILLLAASYLFYGWIHPSLLITFFAVTVLSFWSGRWIENTEEPVLRKRGLLILSATLFTPLAVYKYGNFFLGNLSRALELVGYQSPLRTLELFLPIGISFYTFQAVSYLVDIYRRELTATRSLVQFALYLSFFPQLVAGPIERAKNLLDQLAVPRSLTGSAATSGLLLVCWGYLKKVVIADNIAPVVNRIFANGEPSFPLLWVAVFGFSIQIYADFSAYSDIARGVSRLLGIDLMINFNHPYLSRSPAEFWRRWHISLSTWFRDYVFIPLGGSRSSVSTTARNLLITFTLSGLWHGASWNYIFWGVYHGLLVTVEMVWRRLGLRVWLPEIGKGLCTYLLILIGWLLFRETNLTMLLRGLTLSPLDASGRDWHIATVLGAQFAVFATPLMLHPFIERGWEKLVNRIPAIEEVGRSVATAALILGILALHTQNSTDFIYFQF